MQLEIEATFIEIVKDELRAKLKTAGATLIRPETFMRRVVFNISQHAFARVRDEGDRVVLTYKNQRNHTITGTEEINVEVSDYSDTIAILKACGLHTKSIEDTYRESWKLGDVEIDIDTWPWIPSFVEIEGQTPKAVKTTSEQLGFDMKDAIIGSVDEIYKLYYDVTSEDINFGLSEIKFTDAPAKLASKLRKIPLPPATKQADPNAKPRAQS